MINALLIIVLTHLSLSNEQRQQESITIEPSKLKPVSSNEPVYPYEEADWAEIQQPDIQLPDPQPKHDLKFPDDINLADLLNKDWVIDRVKSISQNQSQLRNDTDRFMQEFQDIYASLGLDDSDNKENTDNLYKYVTSVILRFILEFYRIFRRISSSQSNVTQMIDAYGTSYDEAVNTMKAKKNYTHLELAVPVRRAADIFKSILYESVEIVQTKCKVDRPNWECLIMYLAELISESLNCTNIWHHALIHMLTLDVNPRQNHLVYNIANFVKLTGLPFEHIFDYTMEKIVEYREIGRIQFRKEALLFSMLADLQENGLLDCVYINDMYN